MIGWEVRHMFKNWTNRDWFWLMGFLIFIIVLLLANFYLHWDTKLSIVANTTSIALAVIAIFLSLKQDSENKISSDSKHLDISKQLRELNSVLISKQNGIAEVVTNVEESLNEKEEESDKQDNYSHDQLKEYGEKIRRDTIETFKKELNKKALNEIEDIDFYSNNQIKKLKKALEKEKYLVKSYIEMVGEYTIHDVLAYVKDNGVYSTENRIKEIINILREERNN